MRVERRGDLAVWTLDRPRAKNALDAATFVELARAIEETAGEAEVRAVVLTADGDTFAAGGDLRELRSATTTEDAERLAEVGRAVCDGLAALPQPVLAALPGPAIGGGVELAMACDLRIAAPRATLCFKHAHMGVTTAWGVLPRVVSALGPAAAAQLLLTARTVDAVEALRLGLVDAVSDDAPGASVELALAWGREIARGAPMAVAGMKALLREATRSEHLLAMERSRFVASWTSADHGEAVEAYFAKRPPVWTGK